MISFLKNLFSRNDQLPQVELTGFRGGLVGVRSQCALPLTEQLVETRTPAGEWKTRLRIHSYDPKAQEYLAQLDEDDPTLSSLDIDLANLARVSKALRVSSRELPLYTALTEEVSLSGIRISTDGPLVVNRVLQVSVEFDSPELGTQKFETMVEWSADKGEGKWHSWLRFQALDAGTFRRLGQYIQECRRRTSTLDMTAG